MSSRTSNEQLTHGRNCPARFRDDGDCTCGLKWRIQIARLQNHLAQKSAQITRLQDGIEKMQQGTSETNGNQADAEATAYSAPSAGGMLPNNPARTDSRGFRLSSLGHPIEAICGSCSTPLITHDDEWFMHDCDCMKSPVKSGG